MSIPHLLTFTLQLLPKTFLHYIYGFLCLPKSCPTIPPIESVVVGVFRVEGPFGGGGLGLGVIFRARQLQGHLVLVAEGLAGPLDVLLLGQLLGATRRRAGDLVRPVEEGVVHLETGQEKRRMTYAQILYTPTRCVATTLA